MTALHRYVPQPLMTLAITALWLALATSPTLGNFLLGLAIGLVIPRHTAAFWPNPPRLRRPLLAARLMVTFLGDIVVSNFQVARQILGPAARLRPALVEVPLDIHDPFVATVLAGMVTLTPGTLSIDINRDKNLLLLHALDVGDEAELVRTIKARYETPLKEIFAC